MNEVIYKSTSCEWSTPPEFFEKINAHYHFDLDVCATPENAKCPKYFTEQDNALVQDWDGVCWMNPPYGKTIRLWMKKAYEESLKGATVVCLVPARTDTYWWHEYAIKGKVFFVRGRLKFGGSENNAPFPSAVVVFGADDDSKEMCI